MTWTKSYGWIFAFCLLLTPLLLHAQNSSSYARHVKILGWSQDGKQLIFREETRNQVSYEARAAIINAENGKLLKELNIQSADDTPDVVSVREHNLQVLLQGKDFQPSTSAQFFAGQTHKGFLSPDGAYLFISRLEFQPISQKRGLQKLILKLSVLPFNQSTLQEETEFAKIILERIDGAHPLGTDSIGAVAVHEMQWGPNGRHVALVLEERRPNTLIQGVVALKMPETFSSNRVPPKELAQAKIEPKPKPKAKPKPKKKKSFFKRKKAKTPQPSSDTLRAYYAPRGGKAHDLAWETGLVSQSNNEAFTAYHHFFKACNDVAPKVFSSNFTILNHVDEVLAEYSISASLSPKDMQASWHNGAMDIMFLGEPLRSIELAKGRFESIHTPPEALAIQLGSFSNERSVQNQVQKLCEEGLPAYYLKIRDHEKNQTLFRLRVGRFNTSNKAKQYATLHIKDLFPNYLVTKF